MPPSLARRDRRRGKTSAVRRNVEEQQYIAACLAVVEQAVAWVDAPNSDDFRHSTSAAGGRRYAPNRQSGRTVSTGGRRYALNGQPGRAVSIGDDVQTDARRRKARTNRTPVSRDGRRGCAKIASWVEAGALDQRLN